MNHKSTKTVQNIFNINNQNATIQFLIKMLMMIILMMVSNLLFLGLAGGISIMVWDYNFFASPEMLANINQPEMLPVIRFFQAMQSIGLFLVPGLFWVWFYAGPLKKGLYIKPGISFTAVLGTFLLIISAMPMINALVSLNEAMNFPDWLSGLEENLQSSETRAMKFMKALLDNMSPGLLLVNLFIIAVLPAVSEEVLFRGVLQNEIERFTQKSVLSIIIAALIFSALHYQFYTFLPRFVLGLMMGLVYYWSRNLWVPIVLHFFNNGITIFAWYFFTPEQIDQSLDKVGTLSYMWPVSILSTGFVILIMYGLRHHFMKHARN